MEHTDRRCAWCGRRTTNWVLDDDGDFACANGCEEEDRMPLNIEVSTPVIEQPRKVRGFSAMPKSKQLELASKGGKASHNPPPGKKRGYEWDAESARAAGRLGGLKSRGGRGAVPKETK